MPCFHSVPKLFLVHVQYGKEHASSVLEAYALCLHASFDFKLSVWFFIASFSLPIHCSKAAVAVAVVAVAAAAVLVE